MARVDFPLHCFFELNRRQEYTITIVQVRERYTDGRLEEMSAILSYLMSIVTNVIRTKNKNGNRLWRFTMSMCAFWQKNDGCRGKEHPCIHIS